MAAREGYLSTVERIPAAFEFLGQRLERKGTFWRVEAFLLGRAVDGIARWVNDFVVAVYPPAVQRTWRLNQLGRVCFASRREVATRG